MLDALAGRFRLGAGQIARAVADAAARGRWNGGDAPAATRASLFAAARAQSGRALGLLAPKVEVTARWDDLILPAEQDAQLREFCAHARLRHHVLEAWGFGRTPTGSRGLNGLFAGPPGTGKTLAAGVIAGALGLDLYCVDLALVVSKYIGETQKNLDRIFAAAADANAVLLFDEAEALFGARSEVRDAHDRYANIEVAYLLQKMEAHDGITILATNLRQNLDPAFLRRLHAVVEFPFPDAAQRRRIWQVAFPPEAPLDGDVDLDALAQAVKLAGGNIRNIAMAAAIRAAEEGAAEEGAADKDTAIAVRHLLAAARREHQKLGRAWTEPAA
jgi:SpoVK/Ycf46/Vps4 family AAA+-type ATPase